MKAASNEKKKRMNRNFRCNISELDEQKENNANIMNVFFEAGAVGVLCTVKNHFSMEAALSSSSHVLLALNQHLYLLGNLPKASQDLPITVFKAIDLILNANFFSKLLDPALEFAQIMSRDTREEVMDGLELETTVDPVEPGRAVDVHGSA